jgi:dsDNA-specific endonuclease/ATPase MutS2
MKNINSIIKKVLMETRQESQRYMFFSNLEQMKRQCETLLEMDKSEIEQILDYGHDWAQDHIAEAKNNMDQVFDFLMNETKGGDMSSEMDMEDDDMIEEGRKKKKNKPTNPSLWQQSLSWAKQRYEVCPSAYCNGAAVKRYNSKGGKWKKG